MSPFMDMALAIHMFHVPLKESRITVLATPVAGSGADKSRKTENAEHDFPSIYYE